MTSMCKDPEITLVEAVAAVDLFKDQCVQELNARNDAGVETMHASELSIALQYILDSIIQSRASVQPASIFQIIVVALRQGNVVALRQDKRESQNVLYQSYKVLHPLYVQ